MMVNFVGLGLFYFSFSLSQLFYATKPTSTDIIIHLVCARPTRLSMYNVLKNRPTIY